MADTKFLISTSPHIKSEETTARIMWTVVIALLPAAVAAVVVFGQDAFWLMVTCILASVLTEAIIQKLRGVPVTIADGSAVVTGLLLAFVLAPTVPLYVAATGAIVAIGVAKHAFGGLGCNIWNPALIGRAFIVAAWAAYGVMPAWPIVQNSSMVEAPFVSITGELVKQKEWNDKSAAEKEKVPAAPTFKATTRATPLNMAQGKGDINEAKKKYPEEAKKNLAEAVKLYQADLAKNGQPKEKLQGGIAASIEAYRNSDAPIMNNYYDFIVGKMPGCIGETSKLVLLLGGLLLIMYGYVNWRMPLGYIGTVVLLTWALPSYTMNGAPGWFQGNPFFHMVTGGLFLGAFFMATDMVTSPMTNKGIWIFAIGAGLIVALVRLYGGYPEGVCYSILLMNTVAPLIDRYTKPKTFGTVQKKTA